MVTKQVTVTNKVGFHARPAALLIEKAKQYQSTIKMEKGEQATDLKSIVSLLKMQVKMGDVINLSADGPDEVKAVDELVALIESKFGEE